MQDSLVIRARGWASQAVRRAVPGLRRVAAQVEPYARAWDGANDEAMGRKGRLWVVLGDSTAQGIGAHGYESGYVGQLRQRLDGDDWRILNLSRSGAKVNELLSEFVPRLEALGDEPALVTCAIGANDMVPTPIGDLLATIREVMAHLPQGAVIATIPQGIRPAKAQVVNEVIRHEGPAGGLRVADVWAHTGPPWRGKFASDGFHPNALGYGDWTDAFAAALELPRP